MQVGKQSWQFPQLPAILTTGVVGGPYEKKGPLATSFDKFYDSLWMNEKTYEKAHRLLIEEATNIALQKISKKNTDIDFFLAGDLINQITPTSFAARSLQIPYIGLFSACATLASSLALGALLINGSFAKFVATGASSHHSAVERQFRYPTSYGAQKPDTAQYTVSGAGMAILGSSTDVNNIPVVTGATIGKVIDSGCSDPLDMGTAMALAATETISTYLEDFSAAPNDFDLIITGDLGKIGSNITYELLKQKKIDIAKEKWNDCGCLIYGEDQPVIAGGSGAGCSASVIFGHIYEQIKQAKLKKVLVCATGALLSPLTFQQKETIPCIAHAVAIEMKN